MGRPGLNIKIGEVFNYVTIIKKIDNLFQYKCKCGNIKITSGSYLMRGLVTSCGCRRKEIMRVKFKTHGKTETGTYKTWCGIKERVFKKDNKSFKNYGGRGIKMCKRWLNFENFYEDMGDRPINKTLDRINNNGNYCKKNCRWSDRQTQNNNRRDNHKICFNGTTLGISGWSKKLNVKYATLYNRIIIKKKKLNTALVSKVR